MVKLHNPSQRRNTVKIGNKKFSIKNFTDPTSKITEIKEITNKNKEEMAYHHLSPTAKYALTRPYSFGTC